MHQTTVRFGADLWESLEEECARLGVSVAQYLREAALARLVYAAGRRGDDEFELALELATGAEQARQGGFQEFPADSAAQAAQERAFREGSAAAALAAQGRLARQRASKLRERVQADRSERRSRLD